MTNLQLTKKEERRASTLHEKSIVIDGCQSSKFTPEYFETVKDAGVTATIVTVAWKQTCYESMKLISRWLQKIADNTGEALFAKSIDDILKAKREKKVAYLFGFQNTLPLEGEVELLDIYKALGVRIVQLTYNDKNDVGYGCGEKDDAGLSGYGIQVIERMNKLGMLVDLSHVGDRTTAEAIELARFPVFSHANSRSLCENPRNKPDDQIKAIASKDGIIGVNAYPSFVKWTKTERGEQPSVSDLLDHIDHIVKLVGVDYAGVSLDLIENQPEGEDELLASNPSIWGLPNPDGVYAFPEEIEGISQLINITRGLVARGYSDSEIKKILGHNWLRVLRMTEERVAA